MEFIHGLAIVRHDRDVQDAVQATFSADPEIRLASGAEAGSRAFALGVLPADFHHQAVAERRERLGVERLGPRVVGNRKPDVIDHGLAPWPARRRADWPR